VENWTQVQFEKRHKTNLQTQYYASYSSMRLEVVH